MSLVQEFHQVIRRIRETVDVPAIEEVLLPLQGRAEVKQDEFGFLILTDGSIGPFYTSLDGSLPLLRDFVSMGTYRQKDPIELALNMGDGGLATNTLALGAVNAISQCLMRLAGFDPTTVTIESALSAPTGSIGMVGYFGPLIERYLDRGYRITLVEKKPGRVPAGLNIDVTTDPAALKGCGYIICTASTLINNTLEEILDSVSPGSIVNLMGPSASCLPDPLFARGVGLVGGILIDDPDCLRRAVKCGDSWGRCGRKYQLSAACYPGLESLLAGIERQ